MSMKTSGLFFGGQEPSNKERIRHVLDSDLNFPSLAGGLRSMWYYVSFGRVSKADGFISLEAIGLGILAGYLLWHVHPAVAIVSGIGATFLYLKFFETLYENPGSPAVRTFLYLGDIAAVEIYAYACFLIANFLAPTDVIWKVFGALVLGGLAFWDRMSFTRK